MADPKPAAQRPQPVAIIAVPDWERSPVALPAPLTSFIGRDREIAAVAGLLARESVRLVTITGPGGVGKTRLALRVAELTRSRFPDGVALVPLAAVRDPMLVPRQIARAVGIGETGDQPLMERLAIILRDRQLLLLLDNVEQLLAAAPMVANLLVACPGLKALATSREAMRVSGEHVVALAPLGLSDADDALDAMTEAEAVRLFVDRARAVRTGLGINAENAAAIAEICRRVDGLPLAIELAAAHIAHLSPTALLRRLDRRLPLLTGGARDLPERQRTMSAAIAWSYDLLTPAEQTIFRRLSVFASGFSLDAAEWVMENDLHPLTPSPASQAMGSDPSPMTHDPAPGVFAALAALHAQSLLRADEGVDGEPRYSMLETVREFAAERLTAAGEEHHARNRHLAYFVELAERADPAIWGGPDQRMWLDRLETDFDDFRAALTWADASDNGGALVRLAAALGGLWQFRNHRVEGRVWLARALARAGDKEPAARSMALVKSGILASALGNPDAAELVEQGVTLRLQIGDRRGAARSKNVLATILFGRGDHVRATKLLAESFELNSARNDTHGLAWNALLRGHMAMAASDRMQAAVAMEEALALFRDEDFPYGIARVLLELGRLAMSSGDIPQATARFAESLRLWDEIGSQEGKILTIAEAGHLAAATAYPERAVRLLGAATALADAFGGVATPVQRSRTELVLAEARAALGEPGYAAAWATGRVLTTDAALGEAAGLFAARTGIAGPSGSPVAAGDHLGLTLRERDVLRLLVEGRSDREIAGELGLSYRTVTSYVRNILDKLDADSRTAAATRAIRLGLV